MPMRELVQENGMPMREIEESRFFGGGLGYKLKYNGFTCLGLGELVCQSDQFADAVFIVAIF